MKERLPLKNLGSMIVFVCLLSGLTVSQSFAGEPVYVTNYNSDFISLIDAETNRKLADIRTGNKPHGVAVSPDGRTVYVSNEGDNNVSVIDATARRVIA